MGQFKAWASGATKTSPRLTLAAGVVEGPCGLEELHQFQQALGSQYQLLVMTRMKQFFLIFKRLAAPPHQICLLKSNDHFDGARPFPRS